MSDGVMKIGGFVKEYRRDVGNLFERINTYDMMVKVDVLRAMNEAAEKVTRNPRHE